MHSGARGFTLIEVLIAALILFLVITTMMTIYQGAMLSSAKASQNVDTSLHIQYVKSAISEQIKSGAVQASHEQVGKFKNIDYQWMVTKVARGRALHPDNLDFNVDIPGVNRGSKMVYLWKVNVVINIDNLQKKYEYWEVSW